MSPIFVCCFFVVLLWNLVGCWCWAGCFAGCLVWKNETCLYVCVYWGCGVSFL